MMPATSVMASLIRRSTTGLASAKKTSKYPSSYSVRDPTARLSAFRSESTSFVLANNVSNIASRGCAIEVGAAGENVSCAR